MLEVDFDAGELDKTGAIQVVDAQVVKEKSIPDEKDSKSEQTQDSDTSKVVVSRQQLFGEKWEYKQDMSYSKSAPVKELNKLGADRWELVGFHHERERFLYHVHLQAENQMISGQGARHDGFETNSKCF